MAFRMCWPTRQRSIHQGFGDNPAVYGKFGLPGHEGVDLSAEQGSEIFAVADGFVSDIRLDGFADPMLRPYGNQIRLQHVGGYETIYAHLSRIIVVRGQVVKAGQLIAFSGNTGQSTGPHLHFGLKRCGATVNGDTPYPYDLVDPEPFLISSAAVEVPDLPEPTIEIEVDSAEYGFLEIRVLPFDDAEVIARVPHGALLHTFEDVVTVWRKVGQQGLWLWVRTFDGQVGWALARFVKLPGDESDIADVPSMVVRIIVDSPDGDAVLREGPGEDFGAMMQLAHGTSLLALGELAVVEDKVGRRGSWLKVLVPTGEVGYCAAWLVKLVPFGDKPVIPEPETGEPTTYVVVDCPDSGLRLRAGPGTGYDKVWSMAHQTVLESLEDPVETGRKVGQQQKWIHVRTPAHYEGYAAAWYLRHPKTSDTRQPVDASDVAMGISPHIFGIHAVSVADDAYSRDRIQGLYEGTGKQGWILFTEICGKHPDTIRLVPEIRARLWHWAEAGYGVIIRLNHGYEPGGTLPESKYYDAFAAAAARWVDVYLKDASRPASDYAWTIQIANEQNNPREHPGGFEHPVEHITPERYADAFNRSYAAVKRVLPNAIVCPGAVDPYNYMPMYGLGGKRWRPLDYYQAMMAGIEELDGIILHAYTHGPEVDGITDLKRFGDGTGPLWDHYYNFQIYRIFMEHIPARWRDVPVYLTEMDHIHRSAGEYDLGWINQNVGWVRAAYEEINRWNQMPYAQQIRCGLLYRWMGDAWSIVDKKEILTDFRQALDFDFRWRTDPGDRGLTFGLKRNRGGGIRARQLEERFLMYPDDFTLISGIGEKTQSALRSAGIMIFEQLAQYSPEELEAILSEVGLRTLHVAAWPEQAALAFEGKWDKLAEYRARFD